MELNICYLRTYQAKSLDPEIGQDDNVNENRAQLEYHDIDFQCQNVLRVNPFAIHDIFGQNQYTVRASLR